MVSQDRHTPLYMQSSSSKLVLSTFRLTASAVRGWISPVMAIRPRRNFAPTASSESAIRKSMPVRVFPARPETS